MSDLSFAFLLGFGTFFSPCAVALVPSYLAYFTFQSGTEPRSPAKAAWAALRVALFAVGGILVTFAVLAVGLYLVRQHLEVASSSLFATFSRLGQVVGLLFIVFGILMVRGRAPSLTLRTSGVLPRRPWAMAGWGALFAAGSMGCSLPLALALLARVLAEPRAAAANVMAYAAGLSVVLLVASPILGLLGNKAAPYLSKAARGTQIAGGLLLVVAGAYVAVYYWP